MEVDHSEIVFFDVETNIPRKGQKFVLLEFGAILVCPRKLVELKEYSTLIRPADISVITQVSIKCNGITRSSVSTERRFEEIADEVYDLLHGRVWAGHNIKCFDCPRIREAFAEIGRPAPKEKGIIDSLCLLQAKFGRRAGNLKMATLAEYFGLGIQKHRSLDDVRMNLEVLKYCATVLFLEEAQTSSTPVKTYSPSVPASSNCGQGSALVETPEEKDRKTLPKKKSLSNKSAKKKLNDSVKETREVLDAGFKALNSNVEKDCFDLKILDMSTSICSKAQALEDENVGILLDPNNFASVSGTEQSGSVDSDRFLEPQEEEAQTSSTPVKTYSPSVPVSSNCGQGSALVETSEEKDRKTLPKKKSLSNKSAKKKLNDSVKETRGVLDADFKALNSNVEKDCFDLKILDMSSSICSKAQELGDENVGILLDPINFASVSGTEQSGSVDSDRFLEPQEVNISLLKPAFVPSKWGYEKMTLLHRELPLQLSSKKLKIRFGISKKFLIPTGKPKLSFVVEPSQETCEILKICDKLAHNLYSECNGNSEWRPLVTTKNALVNSIPTIRMHIATQGAGETATYFTDLYERDSAGTTSRLSLTNVDIDELDKLFVYGRLVDANYSFDIYDYKQNAGIRLVAKILTVGL